MTVLNDLPFSDYVAADAVTFHKLLAFEHSPLLYKRCFVTKEAPRREETDALRFGRASHCLTLEGTEAFEKQYVVRPETYIADAGKDKGEVKPWNGNANVCKAWEAAAEARGATPISPKEFALMRELQRAVRQHPDANRILSDGWPEVTIRQQDPETGLTLQGRLDWLTPALETPDYKTTADLNKILHDVERMRLHALEPWVKQSLAYCYLRQLAWYRRLIRNEFAQADQARFFLILAEKEEPYRCVIVEASARLLDLGAAHNAATLKRIATCYAENVWPGGPAGVVFADYTGPEPEAAA